MKKAVSFLLALVFTLLLAIPAGAEETRTIQADGWAVAELTRAWEAGLFPEEMDPFRDTCARGMIRAEFAAITVRLYEALGGTLHLAPSFQRLHPHPFTDIDNYDYKIREAYGLGFIGGVSIDHFEPNGTLTREQAAAMLGRVYEKLNGALPIAAATTFEDDEEIDAYARNAVAFLSRNGVIGGIGGNLFAPKQTLTAQEAVIMALRMLEVESWTVPEPVPTPSLEMSPEPEFTPSPEETPGPEAIPGPEESAEPETTPDPEIKPETETE